MLSACGFGYDRGLLDRHVRDLCDRIDTGGRRSRKEIVEQIARLASEIDALVASVDPINVMVNGRIIGRRLSNLTIGAPTTGLHRLAPNIIYEVGQPEP